MKSPSATVLYNLSDLVSLVWGIPQTLTLFPEQIPPLIKPLPCPIKQLGG